MTVGNGAKKDLEDAVRNRGLTARQSAVLELLSRGDTNKTIARPAGDEGRYRQSSCAADQRKFGVTNRTQLAVVCANGQPSQKAATPAEF